MIWEPLVAWALAWFWLCWIITPSTLCENRNECLKIINVSLPLAIIYQVCVDRQISKCRKRKDWEWPSFGPGKSDQSEGCSIPNSEQWFHTSLTQCNLVSSLGLYEVIFLSHPGGDSELCYHILSLLLGVADDCCFVSPPVFAVIPNVTVTFSVGAKY